MGTAASARGIEKREAVHSWACFVNVVFLNLSSVSNLNTASMVTVGNSYFGKLANAYGPK